MIRERQYLRIAQAAVASSLGGRMMALVASAFALCVTACCTAAQDDAPPPRVMIGYYASYGDLAVDDVPWHRLTHVCHAFLTTDAQGKPVTNDSVPSQQLTAAAHEHEVRVLLSLGGGKTTKAFEKITNSDKSIARYVNQVCKLAVLNGYDGIDVDWEHPRSEAMQANFVKLIVALRAKLDAVEKSGRHGERYELTAAVSASKYFGKYIEVDQVIDHVDWLHIMTYDFSGPWDRIAAHNAPLLPSHDDPANDWRSVSQAMDYWSNQRSVPANKLVVGLPFYGRAFPATERYAPLDLSKKSQHGVLAYRDIRQLLHQRWKASWDDDLQVPWLQTPTGKQLLVAYDDRNSIYRKTTWTREQGYRGVFFWALHQDRMPDGKHWLVEASHKAWPE